MGQQGDAIDKCRMATRWCSWRTWYLQNANARMSSTGIVSQGCASDGTVGSETIQVVLQVLAVGAQDVQQWRSQMVVVVREQVVGQQLRMTGFGTADWSNQQICRKALCSNADSRKYRSGIARQGRGNGRTACNGAI